MTNQDERALRERVAVRLGWKRGTDEEDIPIWYDRITGDFCGELPPTLSELCAPMLEWLPEGVMLKHDEASDVWFVKLPAPAKWKDSRVPGPLIAESPTLALALAVDALEEK